MKEQHATITYQNTTYPVKISRKRMKNIIFRYRNGVIEVSAPLVVTKGKILDLLEGYLPKLLVERDIARPITDEYYYLFGKLIARDPSINDEQLNKYLTSELLIYLKKQVAHFIKIMDIPISYQVRVKKMSSRYGSNSKKTNSLSFNQTLIHYDKDVIDMVIIHELVHYYVSGHQKDFYYLLEKYCPNYQLLNHQLKKGEFTK